MNEDREKAWRILEGKEFQRIEERANTLVVWKELKYLRNLSRYRKIAKDQRYSSRRDFSDDVIINPKKITTIYYYGSIDPFSGSQERWILTCEVSKEIEFHGDVTNSNFIS